MASVISTMMFEPSIFFEYLHNCVSCFTWHTSRCFFQNKTFSKSLLLWFVRQFILFQKDVEKLFDAYTNITNKYRKLLEEESLLQQSTQKTQDLREELTKTQTELEDSRKKLAVQTQRYVIIENHVQLQYHRIVH